MKLNGKEYVPPPADDEGNFQLRIRFTMHDSAADDPLPLQVRLVMSTSVTLPLPVIVIATLIVPARLGFTLSPCST